MGALNQQQAEAEVYFRRQRALTLLKEKAPEKLLAFTRYTMRDFQINWHHKVTALALERFYRREIENLMIFMPPRVGKTELVSRRFPAWAMGKNPDLRVIATSYASQLADKTNREVQRIIDSEIYREIFPNTTLAGPHAKMPGSWARKADLFEVAGYRGTYRSTGVGGGITGMGGDLLLMDDPLKNSAEANSKTKRDAIYEWYTTTLYTRRESGAGICLIMTRWHEDDLAGRLLINAKQNGANWTVISFPMIHEGDAQLPYPIDPEFAAMDPRGEGEALWPEKYDQLESEQMLKSAGKRAATSLYQQRPAAAEGNVIKREWLKFYRTPPARYEEMLISVDCAFRKSEDSAKVAMGVWGRVKEDKYLHDQVCDQMGFVETVKALRRLKAAYPRASIIVETKANGDALIDTLKSEISGIVGYEPDGSKEARLWAVSTDFESGNVFLPEPELKPWVHDYVQELLAFPSSAYADQVDQTSQALLRFRESASRLLKALTKR